jgi:glucokinase
MILAGDIGGTKTNLGLFDVADGALTLRKQKSFPSKRFSGLESIIDEFMKEAGGPSVAAACFGVAGPIVEARSITPNLPWVVESASLASSLRLDSVALLNDLETTAHGISELRPEEFATLNEGTPKLGNAALVAAGTGMGSASLFWDGAKHVPSASEGGHMDFAPRDQLEGRLLQHLIEKHGHVSIERVLSGPGLFRIYDFLRASDFAKESPAVVERFKQNDPSGVIANAAMAFECGLCEKALDMFASIYGATAGNIALLVKAVAGVYIGGGIAPKIINKLKDGTFMKAFADKGRLSPLLEAIPVRVILNDKTALLGAARVAAKKASLGPAV